MTRGARAGGDSAPVVQRRADYRVDVPVGEDATCTFRIPRKFDRPAYALRLDVCDASAGGLTVADYDRCLVGDVGSTLRACALRLPGHARPITVDLELLRTREQSLPGKPMLTLIVCQFSKLPYAASLAIRRYLIHLERRQIARERSTDRWHTH